MKMKASRGSGWLVGFSVVIASVWLVACGSSGGPGGGAGGASATGGAIGAGAGGAIGAGGVTTAAGGAGGAGTSATCHAAGTLQVTNSGFTAYVIDGVSNPDLTFCRGSTYVFSVNATGHPFYIKTVRLLPSTRPARSRLRFAGAHGCGNRFFCRRGRRDSGDVARFEVREAPSPLSLFEKTETDQ